MASSPLTSSGESSNMSRREWTPNGERHEGLSAGTEDKNRGTVSFLRGLNDGVLRVRAIEGFSCGVITGDREKAVPSVHSVVLFLGVASFELLLARCELAGWSVK